ncbi:hypothetical protein KW807_02315 [Candidatus Parcubacteria bacterium]|nr:hypothetical protein [Candidatus Parcubacteria bacterium]
MKNSTAFILIILAIGLFYTFTQDAYSQVKALQASASDERNVLDNLSRITEAKDRLALTYGGIPKVEIERLGKILPPDVDTVRLALDLDSLAARHNISIKDVHLEQKGSQDAGSIDLEQSDTPYNKAQLTFRFVASYPNFRSFLGDLETSLRIMDVESVSFTAPSDDKDKLNLSEYQVTVETYWLK